MRAFDFGQAQRRCSCRNCLLTKRALCRVPDSREILGAKLDMKIAGDRPDVLGYAIVRGVTIEILDVSYFLEGSARWGGLALERTIAAVS